MSIDTSTFEHGTELLDRSERTTPETSATPRRDDGEFALQLQEATLADLCAAAVADVAARYPDRTVRYAADPDPDRRGSGTWDPRRLGYAVTILLEDALKRTGADAPVSLSWREDGGLVIVRVQFARPLERGDRFVTFFEDGVRPDGAVDNAGTLRLVVARKIVHQHRGELARIRTYSGTAYVATLPRSPDVDAVEADAGL
jgi:signal transduction histidine kinase